MKVVEARVEVTEAVVMEAAMGEAATAAVRTVVVMEVEKAVVVTAAARAAEEICRGSTVSGCLLTPKR